MGVWLTGWRFRMWGKTGVRAISLVLQHTGLCVLGMGRTSFGRLDWPRSLRITPACNRTPRPPRCCRIKTSNPEVVSFLLEARHTLPEGGSPPRCLQGLHERFCRCLGLRIHGAGLDVPGWGRRVQGLGCRVQGLGRRAQCSWLKPQGLGCMVYGSGCMPYRAGSMV